MTIQKLHHCKAEMILWWAAIISIVIGLITLLFIPILRNHYMIVFILVGGLCAIARFLIRNTGRIESMDIEELERGDSYFRFMLVIFFFVLAESFVLFAYIFGWDIADAYGIGAIIAIPGFLLARRLI
jgi:hypothetical protein